jgi:hypothetical protein
MLKRVIINGKRVPVPVPVKTLAEALRWVEETLVPAGHSITRVALDDRQLGDLEPGGGDYGAVKLGEQTKLEVRIDSPVDLAVQTLEAIRNLSAAVGVGLKPLAVELWQARPGHRSPELDGITGDLQLMLDLIDHVTGLVDPMHVDISAAQGIGLLLRRATLGAQMAKSNSDWKGAARILLNRIEPQLKELVNESETLQLRILSQQTSGQAAMRPPPQNLKAPTG